MGDIARIIRKYSAVKDHLDERAGRVWTAAEARELGYGGISLLADAIGVSRTALHAGMKDIAMRLNVVMGFLLTSCLWCGQGLAAECSAKGKELRGRVKVVESFPDLKVQVVDSFPDLRVMIVTSFPEKCGEWQMVDSFPDFTIQYVASFPDIKVRFVSSFPGKP
jgi:hypothetical protein